MGFINTRTDLHSYIRSTLGEPIITVEITDVQIDNAIDYTIQKFSDYAAGGEEYKLFQISAIPGVTQYELDQRVKAVWSVKLKSNGFSYSFPGNLVITPDTFFSQAFLPNGGMDVVSVAAVLSKIDMIQQYFDLEPEWDFNDNTKILSFYKDPSEMGTALFLIKVSMEYVPEEVDMIYNHQWVKDMAVAKCKFQWGSNVGKYNTPLINGATMNYERILSEATAEIQKLDGELLTRWTAPLGIYR